MQLISIEDLAVYLGVSKRTIYKYLADGDCPPYVKLSAKNISFDRADVDAWLESKKVYPKGKGEPMVNSNVPCDGTAAAPIDPDRLPWTPRAKAVLDAARRQARKDGFVHVGTEHLLVGMVSVRECLGATILEHLGVSQEKCRDRYEQLPHTPVRRVHGRISFSEDADQAMRCAREQARQWGHTYLGAEHLLGGILMAQRGAGFQILTDLGITLDLVRAEAARLIVCLQTSGK